MGDVNEGGFEAYFNSPAGIFRKELEKSLKVIESLNVLKLIKKANAIVDEIEKRIGKSIEGNIENITEEESEALNVIYEKYQNFEEELLDDLRKYIIYNRNEEF